jgi:endonuclease III
LHGNKSDPLDELIYIILSQMTTAPSFGRVFDRLQAALGDWSRLLDLPQADLAELISDAGLSRQRSARLKSIAFRLASDFGRVTLHPLNEMTDELAESFLVSLPGVGLKTAKCVLMYSLGRRVLPVDTHVARVSRRLGLLPPEARTPIAVHRHLESMVPPRLRYSFHVNAIALGREACRAPSPRCYDCALVRICPTGQPTL